MVQRYTDIQTPNWQPALGRLGEAVTELDDIDQCIEAIACTRPGQVPFSPLFGNPGLEYIDAPLNEAAPSIIRGTAEAIKVWEPRAVVERVVPSLSDSGIDIVIEWHPAVGDPATRRTVVSV